MPVMTMWHVYRNSVLVMLSEATGPRDHWGRERVIGPGVEAAIGQALRPGEQVLWTEPRQDIRADLTISGFTALVSLAWIAVMPIAVWQNIRLEGPVFADFPAGHAFDVIICAIFLLGAIALLVCSVDSLPSRDVYVLTDQRTMTGIGFLRPRVKDGHSLESLRPESVELRRDERGGGSIVFWDHAWTDSDGDRHAPKWANLLDAPHVHALILHAMGRREHASAHGHRAAGPRIECGTGDETSS